MSFPNGYEWTGEYQDIEVKRWWCPSEQQWVECPGPCPTGELHDPMEVTMTQAKVLRRTR